MDIQLLGRSDHVQGLNFCPRNPAGAMNRARTMEEETSLLPLAGEPPRPGRRIMTVALGAAYLFYDQSLLSLELTSLCVLLVLLYLKLGRPVR